MKFIKNLNAMSSESIQFAAFAHVLYYDVGKLHCAILYVHFSLSLSMITL